MPRHIGSLFLGVLTLFFLSSGVLFAQEATTTAATTQETVFVPTPTETPLVPQTQTGFGNYVGGIPTTFTLPDGTVMDISIPKNTVAEDSTQLRSQPKVPKAFDRVTFTVENYSTKLEEDRIIWSVDGEVVQDQIGGDSIVVNMGKVGETKDVRVTIDSRSLGRRWSRDLSLTPGDVAVLWEANTYIPPFYKGKPLPSYKSTIKLVPFPTISVRGRTLSPDNLLYKWSRNYRNIKEISGYGKRFSVLQTGGGAQQERLQLTVSDPESGATTERAVTITIAEPKVLLYGGSPLQGVRYERVLGSELLVGELETTVRAEPFFFSNEELENGSSPVQFTQNGRGIPSLYRTVVLQRPSQGGTSRIEASIENPLRVLQVARKGISIKYQSIVP